MDNVPPKYVGTLRSRKMIVDVEQTSSVLIYMYPNVQPGKWTANADARLALSWAINRQQILDDVFAGYGVPESTLPMDGAQYYDPTLGRFFGSKPNLAKAKSHLHAAGGPPSKPLDVVVLTDNLTSVAAPIVQQNMEAIGVPVNLISLAETPALARLFAQQFDLFVLDVTAQQSTGYGAYIAYLAVFPGAFANFNKFNDPLLTSLVSRAVAVRGSSAQAAAWRAVQAAWVDLVPQILFVTGRYVEAWNPSVRGYAPTGLTQLWNLKYASVA
jgi:ABC-type transport system substrate-binding protein